MYELKIKSQEDKLNLNKEKEAIIFTKANRYRTGSYCL